MARTYQNGLSRPSAQLADERSPDHQDDERDERQRHDEASGPGVHGGQLSRAAPAPAYAGRMPLLRLYALTPSELGSLTDPATARARRVAADERVRSPAPGGLLSRLGPLTRDERWPLLAPAETPTRSDVETLLRGEPEPGRLAQAWRIVGWWIDDQAAGRLVMDLAPGRAEPAWITLLLRRPAAVGLPPLPGMRVGYAPPGVVPELRQLVGERRAAEWLDALPREPASGVLGIAVA